MKLCIECKWFDDGICTAPRGITGVNPVNGKVKRSLYCCENIRTIGWLFCRTMFKVCGREGRWFEPKPK